MPILPTNSPRDSRRTDQRGFAHLALILIVVVVVGVIGFAGWRVMSKNKTASTGNAVTDAVARITASKECLKDYNDKDLCKFLSSWNINKKFKTETTSTTDGKTTTSALAVDGDNSSIKLSGDVSMEVITIGDTTYTKAGTTWWKQTAKKAEPQTKYERIGKEACGNLTCFKYKVVDPKDTDTTQHIWFDTKDYLIRKTLTESKDGSKSESVFSYDNVSVTVPSPVKELGPNQYIVPGQSEPQTLPAQPTEAETQALIKQYSQPSDLPTDQQDTEQ
jgi:Tfp pilus assembly protein PilV